MEIRINLDLPKTQKEDYSKRLSGLEALIRSKNNSDIIDEIRSIKKLLSKNGNSGLEKKLDRIESRLSDIPETIVSSGNKLSRKIDSIDFTSVEKSIKTNTNKILDALINKGNVDVGSQLDIIERKLNKLSLPKTMNFNIDTTPKRQVVPYPC